MTHEEGAFLQILVSLATRGEAKHRRGDYPSELIARYESVARTYSPCNEYALQDLVNRQRDQGNTLRDLGAFIFLEATAEGDWQLPVLQASWNFQIQPSSVGLQVAIFVDGPGGTRDLCAVGYRFECPHGPGIHDYYHAQSIISFDQGAARLPCPDWVPTSQPAFALDAKGPATLLVNLLIALYGLRSEVVNEVTAQRFAGIHDEIQRLHVGSHLLARPV